MEKLILDVDTGIDDSLAIILAICSKKAKVTLLTTCYGSSTIDNTTQNTLNVLALAKRKDIPVAKGAEKPLLYEWDNDIFAHGKTGLGEYIFPKNNLKVVKENAVDAMYKTIMKTKGKTTILALAALTNVAALLYCYPKVRKKIKRIIISGGLLNDNKLKPYISFNIAQDSYASQYVLHFKRCLICPSDFGHQAYFDFDDQEKLAKMNKTGKIFKEIFKSYKDRHVPKGMAATHDACAVACALYPSIFKFQKRYVYLRKIRSLGKCVIDFDAKLKKRHLLTKVAFKINKDAFKKIMFDAWQQMP